MSLLPILMKPRVFTKFGMMHWAVMKNKCSSEQQYRDVIYIHTTRTKRRSQVTGHRSQVQFTGYRLHVTGIGVTMQVGLHNDVGCFFFVCV